MEAAQEAAGKESSVRDRICMECQEPERAHHAFEAYPDPPAGCICPVWDWGNPRKIPAICQTYNDPKGDGICDSCDHEKKCHPAAQGDTPRVEVSGEGEKR